MNDSRFGVKGLMLSEVPGPGAHQLYAGQIVIHEDLGKGIIVGFSLQSDEPCVYFYDQQERFGNKLACVFHTSLVPVDQFNLERVPMRRLIEELGTRDGVEVSGSGLFSDYRLTKRFTGDRGIEADCLLIIRDATLGNGWRRFQPITKERALVEAFCEILQRTKLSNEDIMVILRTLKINPDYFSRSGEGGKPKC